MKILKISFSAFLLVVLGLALLTPAQAKMAPSRSMNIYPYYYPYFIFNKDISNIKSTDNVGSIHVPKVSEVIKKLK
ncbi:MAG: hypothetical protein WC564_00190 [Patescibacteria group bacterium]|jgi:hypothetical protein